MLSGFATFGLALWIALGPAVPSTDRGGPTSGDPPCDAPEARTFDFWLGEWSITQRILTADGSWITLPAKTTVTTALDGCAILERWEGQVQFYWEGMERPEPMRAISVRAYDADSGEWRIHWMDTRSPRFGPPFTGSFQGERGVFTRSTENSDGQRLTRIVFSGITKDSADWRLEVSSDGGASWLLMWTMEMKRVGP